MCNIDGAIRYFDMGDLVFLQQPDIVLKLTAYHVRFKKEAPKEDRDSCIPEQPDLFMKSAREQRGPESQLDHVNMRAGHRYMMLCLHDARPFIIGHCRSIGPGLD